MDRLRLVHCLLDRVNLVYCGPILYNRLFPFPIFEPIGGGMSTIIGDWWALAG